MGTINYAGGRDGAPRRPRSRRRKEADSWMNTPINGGRSAPSLPRGQIIEREPPLFFFWRRRCDTDGAVASQVKRESHHACVGAPAIGSPEARYGNPRFEVLQFEPMGKPVVD